MIVVTGTKRSGTSMWMQVLKAAGCPVIGEAFPKRWAWSIRDANPRGFYESGLRRGIPEGAVDPEATRSTAVKVFVPGVLATDVGLLHRVVISVRDWRSQSASLRRLYDLEDGWLARGPLGPGETEDLRQARLQRVRQQRGQVPPPVEWFLENLALVRDARHRRYPHHVVPYGTLVGDPVGRVGAVLDWIGLGDPVAAAGAVDPALRTPDVLGDEGLDPATVRQFDAFYLALQGLDACPVPAGAWGLPAPLLERMDAVEAALLARWSGHARWRDTWDDPDT